MICNKCKNEIRKKAKFCNHCGNSLSNEAVQMGTLLHSDRYVVIKTIKSGGMGTVYKALDKNLSAMPMAIKAMKASSFTVEEREQAIKRFKKECLLLAKLRHSALPVVHNFFVENDNYYIIMDFIEGKDLSELLKGSPEGRFPPERIITWGIEMCDILDYLHSYNPPIIHRDIKPSNFMLSEESGKIMLVDFGIARFFEDERTVTLMGTRGYVPPEVFGGRITTVSDIYSLGATLNFLLTGYDCDDESDSGKLTGHNISPGLNKIIKKSMELKPELRFQSAKEMKEALISLQSGKYTDRTQNNKEVEAPPVHSNYKPQDFREFLEEKPGESRFGGHYSRANVSDFVISVKQAEDINLDASPFPYEDEHIEMPLKTQRPKNTKELTEEGIFENELITTVKLRNKLGPDRLNSVLGSNLNIDIGNSHIKLLQMKVDKFNFIYPDFLIIEESPDDNLYNIHSLAKIIRNHIKINRMDIKSISLSIPSNHSIISTLILPRKEEKKISQLIREELESEIAFSYNKIKLDCYMLCPKIPGDEGNMKVLVTGMNNQIINNFNNLAGILGFKLNTVISASRALYNSLKINSLEGLDNLAILDIGTHTTDITIIKNGILAKTLCIREGILNFAKAVAISKKITIREALDILETVDIDITRAEKENLKLFYTIVNVLGEWIVKLSKAFKSFGMEYKIDKRNYSAFVLTGGGATIKNMHKYIGNQIGIKCYNMKMPVSEIEEKYNIFLSKTAPIFSTCLGLSINDLYSSEEEKLGEKINIQNGGWLSAIFGG